MLWKKNDLMFQAKQCSCLERHYILSCSDSAGFESIIKLICMWKTCTPLFLKCSIIVYTSRNFKTCSLLFKSLVVCKTFNIVTKNNQIILKESIMVSIKILSSTAVFNIDNNKKSVYYDVALKTEIMSAENHLCLHRNKLHLKIYIKNKQTKNTILNCNFTFIFDQINEDVVSIRDFSNKKILPTPNFWMIMQSLW